VEVEVVTRKGLWNNVIPQVGNAATRKRGRKTPTAMSGGTGPKRKNADRKLGWWPAAFLPDVSGIRKRKQERDTSWTESNQPTEGETRNANEVFKAKKKKKRLTEARKEGGKQ